DVYIEKEKIINEEIVELRHNTINALIDMSNKIYNPRHYNYFVEIVVGVEHKEGDLVSVEFCAYKTGRFLERRTSRNK
ncbi:hypothetical protein OC713_02580, partial [Sweet potato little leaf phytoplasma]|uniref:hypothetical protein n=1 Tax=Candidatus Phytoplasma australasiaticum TaxID=2754999 RepID=UPI00271356C6